MKNGKAIAGVVVVFLLGALCGGVATHMVHRSRMEAFVGGGPAAREELLIKRLTKRLGLDSQQLEQVKPIIHETHAAIRGLHRQSRPRVEALLEESQKRISAILRPDQRERFEQLIAERRKHDHHGAPPSP